MEAQQKLKTSQSNIWLSEASAEDRFLAILNNRDKLVKGADLPVRKNGFVVLVHGTNNLKHVQDLCFDKRQKWNKCLTARYRIKPPAVFGSLLQALVSDLHKMDKNTAAILGDFAPKPTEASWKKLSQQLFDETSMRWPTEKHGFLDQKILDEFFMFLAGGKTLERSRRIVLFAELDESEEDSQEWNQAISILFRKLPERMGLVLTGVPEDFHLPENDPHFLELELPAPVPDEKIYKPAAFHTDRAATEDRLGLKGYANALARFILHPQTRPPLTIGIHGPWGKGKSSFMKLVDIALVKFVNNKHNTLIQELTLLEKEIEETKVEVERTPSEDNTNLKSLLQAKKNHHEQLWGQMRKIAEKEVLAVDFNAWQYEDAKQIWAGLASVVSQRLEQALSLWSRIWLHVNYAWYSRKSELVFYFSLLIIVVLLAGILFFVEITPSANSNLVNDVINEDISEIANNELPGIGNFWRILLPSGSLFLAFCLTVWRIFKVAQPVSERVRNYIQLPSYREQMGFQHQVMKDLKFVYTYLKKGRPNCKVIVFIDDLDRCSEEKIMEILQAINLILGSSEFFVFLGMDTEMIHRAIRSHYSHDESDEDFLKYFPANYLRKILQLSFHLPETPSEKRFEFVETLFSTDAKRKTDGETDKDEKPAGSEESESESSDTSLAFDLNHLQPVEWGPLAEVEDTPEELEAFGDYQEYLQDNPREIKRLVNVHRLVKILLQLEHQAGPWSKDRQRKLVKWLIFCSNWSFLVDDLLAMLKDVDASENCLETLAKQLKTPPDKLEEFARHEDVLAAKDIGEDFRLAAHISQMVQERPEPKKDEEE
ncbi:MAG: hypothetical protein HQ562_10495 [Candidatus Marinimicrobia bacterium]|nr:hypothetical protein [Candidatus Neomarinimicrobiota bacterium]